MPYVKNRKILIRGACDNNVVQFVPEYELQLAMRKWRSAHKRRGTNNQKHYKPVNDSCCDEIPFEQSEGPDLRRRNVVGVDREYARLLRQYGQAEIEHVYPTAQSFTKAVEKEILSYSAKAADKSEVILSGKKLGLSAEHCEMLDEAGIRTLDGVKNTDLAKLSAVLKITPEEAQKMRQSWWGDEEPVVVED